MPESIRRTSLLIDSNIFIAAEDHGADGHAYGAEAAELVRLVGKLGLELLVSHGTISDTRQAGNDRGAKRRRALQKYTVLAAAPRRPAVEAQFPSPRSLNDAADAEVLNTLATGRADYLVTNDRTLRRRAARAELSRVLSLADALEFVRSLQDPTTVHVPAVTEVTGYQLNLKATIFDGLRHDYPTFDDWWRTKVARRDVIVLGSPNDPEGISVLKPEEDGNYPLQWPALKICTFKVKDEFQGGKRGELLLRATVDYARQRRHARCYLEVFPDKAEMVAWLVRFGFARVPGAGTDDGQIVMLKQLEPGTHSPDLEPLAHAVAYGPGAIRVKRMFAVPIQDRWVTRLLPEVTGGDLFTGTEGSGNAIRKAYLCRAPSNKLRPGDTLAFVHTQAGTSCICALGTVEQTLRSQDADEIITFVGTRTVYSRTEIEELAAKSVLAILFRHYGPVGSRILVTDMTAAGVLKGVPQSVTEFSDEGAVWVRDRLGV